MGRCAGAIAHDRGCEAGHGLSCGTRARVGGEILHQCEPIGICWYRSESELAFPDGGVKKENRIRQRKTRRAKGQGPRRGSRPNRTRLSILTGLRWLSLARCTSQPARAFKDAIHKMKGRRRLASKPPQHIHPSLRCNNHRIASTSSVSTAAELQRTAPGSLRPILSAEAHQPWSKTNCKA